MHPVIQKLEDLFSDIRNNVPGADEAFFRFLETSTIPAIIVPKAELRTLLEKLLDWTTQHANQHPRTHANALSSVCFIDFHDSRYDTSMKHALQAQAQFEQVNDKKGAAKCTVMLGACYRTFGEVELAIKHLLEGYEELQNYPGEAFYIIVMYQLAELYAETAHYDRSLELHEKLIKISQDTSNKIMEARSLAGVAGVYMKQGNRAPVLEYLTKAFELTKASNAPASVAKALTDMGVYYEEEGKYDLALDYQQRALRIREDNHIIGGAITNMMHISDVLEKANKPGEAIPQLENALAQATAINVKPKMFQAHLKLCSLKEKAGDTTTALAHFREYHRLRDEVVHDDLERKIANQQIIMEAEQTRKDNVVIKAQKEEIEQKNEELKHTIEELKTEKKRSDDLLLNILPFEVAEELKEKGYAEAKYFEEVTVLFTDFVGFTKISEQLNPQELIDELHICFKAFDEIISRHNNEKIKTIGDAYLAVCGVPVVNTRHAENIVNAAIEINEFMQQRKQQKGSKISDIRIGVHTGSVVAGIVGVKKFAYDIWGDTVNTAARMEQHSEPGKINISQTTYELVKDKMNCTYRGEIEAKNKGSLKMYFVA